MPVFRKRSYQKELLDRDDIPFEEIRKNMQELNFINTHLGGHKITLQGIKQLIKMDSTPGEIRIVEIGSGGGDNLRVIRKWAEEKRFKPRLTGIDINRECIQYAETLDDNSGIEFILSDYKAVRFGKKPHIIFSSLFTHHFTEDELVVMLHWMNDNSELGFFINDLHRHPVAYYSIRFMTRLFSKSYLVKNDAPLSVLRGFTRKEWKSIFAAAGLRNFNCQWKWAFRWLIVVRKQFKV